MKKSSLPKIYISQSIICDSKRLDGTREHFKQAIVGLIKGGVTVAAYDNSTDKPTMVFSEVKSFENWYENFVRIQGWEVPDFSPTEYQDHSDYFNCCTIE